MTISTHHHIRNGDAVTNILFDTVKEMGIKNIRWFPSASFPVHSHLIKYLEDGTIHHIEPNVFSYFYSASYEDKKVGYIIFVLFNTEVYTAYIH